MLNFRRFFSQPRGTHPHQTRNRRTSDKGKEVSVDVIISPPPPRCGVVYWRWWWLERCKATWDWNFEPVPVEQISPRGFLSANPRTYPPRLVGFGINRLCSCSFFHIPACYACCSSFCLVVCRFKHDNMCCLLTRYLLITFYIAA